MYINDMKQEMDEDLFDQMAEALHSTTPIQQPSKSTNHNIHKMETRRNLRQETIRPQLFFKVLSTEIINPFHLSRLRTNHHKQIQSIKTPSNQQMYEQQTTLEIKLSH